MFKGIFKHIRQGTLFAVLAEILEAKRNERKIKRELDSVLALPEQSAKAAAEKLLKKYFRQPLSIEHGLPGQYIKNIGQFIVSRRKGRLLPESKYNALLAQTEELGCARLSARDWNKLCFLSICNGLFRLSAIHRNKAIDHADKIINCQSASWENLQEAFKAAVDQGEYKKADEIIDRINRIAAAKTDREKINLFYNLIKGDRNTAWLTAQSFYSIIDQAFAHYLEGKTVAVVGPAPSGENLGAEINAYDVVVRFNYRGSNFAADSKEFGSKVNVSYYNNEAAKIMSNLENNDVFGDLDYAVFKAIKYPFQHRWYDAQRGRILFLPDDFLFCGSANITPIALYDLLHYRAAKIKLFKVNFYLAADTHYAGYRPAQCSQDKDIYNGQWYDFAVHNPLTQLNFTRNLWRSGQIEVDNACEAVLRLSSEEYMSKMEKIYVERILNSL